MRRTLVTGLTALAVAASGALAFELRAARDAPPVAAPRTESPSASPSESPAPSPSPEPPLAVPLDPDGAPAPTGAGVARALAGALRDPALGPRVNVAVVDGATGEPLFLRGADTPVVPASTAKIATGVAALAALGPDAVLTTRVVSTFQPEADGTLHGDLVLEGGGDPTLTLRAAAGYPRSASLTSLASQVRGAGVRRVLGRVIVSSGPFRDGLGPGWKPTYFSEGSVARITGLSVDGGRVRPNRSPRHAQPDLAAGRDFVTALRGVGVTVGAAVARGAASGDSTELARVTSPPVRALVERMLVRSDNDLAEALGRHVAIKQGLQPTFAGVAEALRAALEPLGAGAAVAGLRDASGLSRLNRLTPNDLVTLVRLAGDPAHPTLRPALAGLPVAGFSGTLATRFGRAPASAAVGMVRAKTGSLDNVSTLAGYVVTRSERVLYFAFSADRLPSRYVGAAARALDAAAAALAGCGCG